ncbi:hypothetical protein SSX86_021077 [Deinandra increscens subsp. villosa]|uniref:Uncharacterized protein n=1 Tax=Deinandra increscens subsp. villosa TaxID=3103831 RepID=A0AAP0GRD5_9ASTR
MLGPFYDPEKHLIGNQIKRALTLLSESEPLTADEISQRVDLKGDKAEFFDSLAKSKKISFDGCRYSYKPLVHSRDRLNMIQLRRAFAEAHLNEDDAATSLKRRIKLEQIPLTFYNE